MLWLEDGLDFAVGDDVGPGEDTAGSRGGVLDDSTSAGECPMPPR